MHIAQILALELAELASRLAKKILILDRIGLELSDTILHSEDLVLMTQIHMYFASLSLIFRTFLVQEGGLEPPASCSQSMPSTNWLTPGYGAGWGTRTPTPFLASDFLATLGYDFPSQSKRLL